MIGPFSIRSTHRAFNFPVATSTIRFALRIVAMPIDSASFGTFVSSPPNNPALLWRVDSFNRTRCVGPISSRPGSLNPMWPFVPIPSS